MSSFLRGAARVFSIDHWPARLEKTKALGAETINFDEEGIGDPAKKIKDLTGGKGAICIDAVGYEAVGHSGNGHSHASVNNPAYEPPNPLQVITWITQAARKYSTVAIPGVYGSAYDKFPLGQLFQRPLAVILYFIRPYVEYFKSGSKIQRLSFIDSFTKPISKICSSKTD